MKIKSLIYVPALVLTGIFSVSAENIVPITSLTKNCKPLIDKNFVLPKIQVRGLSERSHKRIARAQEKMADELYDESAELFKSLMESTKDQFVKATAAKMLGYVYSQKGDPAVASQYFTQAIELGRGYLQHQEIQDLTRNVAAFLFGNDEKKKSLGYLETWMKNSNKDDESIYLLYAAILADSGRLRDSICPAYWSAKVAKKPQKNAFGIMLNAHFEFKDFPGTILLLKQLILDFPKEKRYWRNLSSIYVQQDMIDDALAVMEMFYVQGLMETENDYKQLSNIFAYSEIPYRTANILKEGIEKGVVKSTEKNWKNVAQNYHIASELDKAIHAYGKSAKESSHGKNDIKQAELLADRYKYQKAIEAFDRGMKKGEIDDVGKVHFRKGIAYLELKQFNRSIASFEKATKYKKWRRQAVQYGSHAKNRKKQAAKLAAF